MYCSLCLLADLDCPVLDENRMNLLEGPKLFLMELDILLEVLERTSLLWAVR